VVVNYASSKEGADRVVDEIANAGVGRSRYRQMLLKSRGRTSFLQRRAGIRRLDILVNNAGIYEYLPLEDITEEHFHKQVRSQCAGLISPPNKEQSTLVGSIINISSIASTAAPATGSGL